MVQKGTKHRLISKRLVVSNPVWAFIIYDASLKFVS